ncbi:hypothetical protein ICW40_14865 [Actinotalea ferrariae]|uniref:hypothetical protein n=1 Tax=Actinotalea ferrariae TaxID=1386098 RepID=UPI001C8CAD6B|nr:hypothetical protein [Actinotalea ferrariae]MBX9246081.1 hypothetical protein [Actinotalea ferrariae]
MDEMPERAQLGHPAEAEVPQHTGEPGRGHAADGTPLEDTADYELAVEDGRQLPPDVHDTVHAVPVDEGTSTDGGADAGPEFREPGA